MLKLYYHPLSPLARRVWLTLLEKKLEFEPILVNLDRGEQLKPEFLKLNPFHHVPVLIDDNLKIIESLAIMDYLEYKYPEIALLPSNPTTLARVRMAQMVTTNELGSQVLPLVFDSVASTNKSSASKQLKRTCKFLSDLLQDDLYFGCDRFTLGDIVVGNSLILIAKLGFDLQQFSNLSHYTQRLMTRESWQEVQPSQQQIEVWKNVVKTLFKE